MTSLDWHWYHDGASDPAADERVAFWSQIWGVEVGIYKIIGRRASVLAWAAAPLGVAEEDIEPPAIPAGHPGHPDLLWHTLSVLSPTVSDRRLRSISAAITGLGYEPWVFAHELPGGEVPPFPALAVTAPHVMRLVHASHAAGADAWSYTDMATGEPVSAVICHRAIGWTPHMPPAEGGAK